METLANILTKVIGLLFVFVGFGLSIALIIAPIKAIIKLIKDGMELKDVYTAWTILTVILLIFLRIYGIASLIAEIITYIIARNKKKDAQNAYSQAHKNEPSPGSAADNERWKAEREQGKTEE